MHLPTAAIRFALILLSITPSLVVAQQRSRDIHLDLDPAKVLYARSGWAHGYIHGYELGFHAGDVDLEMGRGPRDLSKLKDARECKAHYRREYGDRNRFARGYEDGFRVGYADAFDGREFRAVNQIRRHATGLDNTMTRSSDEFDNGVQAGYVEGKKTGLSDARSSRSANASQRSCNDSGRGQTSMQYCDGFGRGFSLGYDDGYMNQRPVEARELSKK